MTLRRWLKTILTIIGKDLQAEWRSRELVGSMLVFALITIFVFNFALDLDTLPRASTLSGAIWVTLTFTSLLGLERALSAEKDRGGLEGLLLAPVDRTAIFFGKAGANLIFTLVVALLILPAYSLFFNYSVLRPALLGVMILGLIGFISTGTLLAAISIQARSRALLLPILLFPVAIPLLLAAVKASQALLNNAPIGQVLPWINLLVVYDLIFIGLPILVFDRVVEE